MNKHNSLPLSTPEAQGIPSSAVLAFVEEAAKNIQELHSFMLLRHGCVVAQGWWAPYTPERPHWLFSLSKSFASTAIGLAVAEGRLSVDDPVISFFPEETPARVSANLAAMHVRHLLSMSTGHAEDSTGRMRRRRDWVRAFLAMPVKHQPGTHFVYNSGATYMLSAIIQKVTGQKLLDYLQPRLFEPLGIKNPTWESSPEGINVGGWGLSICTPDIASFGQLYLQKGAWEGRQIVPQAWVEEATAFHVPNDGENPDWRQGYGYQFWRCQHGAYRGDGAFGQFCIVMPEQEAVLAITSGVGDMQSVLDLVWKRLLPAMRPAPLPADPAAQEALAARLAGLAYAPPTGTLASPLEANVTSKLYRFAPNELKLRSLTIDFQADTCRVTVRGGRRKHAVTCGRGVWREGQSDLFFGSEQPVVASGVWRAADTLELTVRFIETPFYNTLTCRFVEDRVEVNGKMNVSFGSREIPPLLGKLDAGE
jgi:CubicO group peptidase (beta-lactamase class C family)